MIRSETVGKVPSPLVGFNNNVKHKGRLFHVQTEDSGVRKPHIVTHLFADGGRIIESTRTDYAEHLGREDMATAVRRMMKEQHKAMFIALRDGQLDRKIDRLCGPVAEAIADEVAVASSAAAVLSKMPSSSSELVAVGSHRAAPEPVLPTDSSDRRLPPSLTELVLSDLDVSRPRGAPVAPATFPNGRVASRGTPAHGTPIVTGRSPAGRYAASRPAAIFSPAGAEDAPSIFGGSSISEQSLDEVILSYLAEDLDGSPDD